MQAEIQTYDSPGYNISDTSPVSFISYRYANFQTFLFVKWPALNWDEISLNLHKDIWSMVGFAGELKQMFKADTLQGHGGFFLSLAQDSVLE